MGFHAGSFSFLEEMLLALYDMKKNGRLLITSLAATFAVILLLELLIQ